MSESHQTLAEALAEFSANFDLRSSPARDKLVEKAKFHILDGIGVGLAASRMEDDYASKIVRVVRELGSAPDCTIIGFRERAAPPLAALVNGSLIHGCEYDDAFYERIVHTEPFAIPLILAIGEKQGADGWALLEGWLITTEVALRTACGTNVEAINGIGFHTTAIFGTIGAAAGAGRMLGLDPERLADAISLSVSFTSGTTQGWNDGSGRNKSIQPGWSTNSGIIAALMAEAGYACSHSTLDGPRGLYASHSWKHGGSSEPVLRNLGTDWKTPNIAFKVYTAGARSQALIDCTKELVVENDIKPEEVESVEVTMPSQYAKEFEPGGWYTRMFRPESGYAMHGSWPCNVARMILSREISVQHLTMEGVTEPAMLTLADKVSCKVGDDRDYDPEERPTNVVIHTTRGTFERSRVKSTGFPESFNADRIIDKFQRNARLALPEENVQGLIQLIMGLEQVDDVRQITRLVVP